MPISLATVSLESSCFPSLPKKPLKCDIETREPLNVGQSVLEILSDSFTKFEGTVGQYFSAHQRLCRIQEEKTCTFGRVLGVINIGYANRPVEELQSFEDCKPILSDSGVYYSGRGDECEYVKWHPGLSRWMVDGTYTREEGCYHRPWDNINHHTYGPGQADDFALRMVFLAYTGLSLPDHISVNKVLKTPPDLMNGLTKKEYALRPMCQLDSSPLIRLFDHRDDFYFCNPCASLYEFRGGDMEHLKLQCQEYRRELEEIRDRKRGEVEELERLLDRK